MNSSLENPQRNFEKHKKWKISNKYIAENSLQFHCKEFSIHFPDQIEAKFIEVH